MEEKRNYSFRNEDNEILKFTVRRPTNKEIEDSDVEYSKAFFNALKKGLPTRLVLTNVLRESGAWTDENDKEIEEIERRIAVLTTDKEDVKGRERDTIEERISELDEKAGNLRRLRNSYFSHCAEAIASDSQRDYLVSCVTSYTESGEKVWKDYQAFIDEKDGNVLFRATYEYLMFSNDVPSTLPNEEDEPEKNNKVETKIGEPIIVKEEVAPEKSDK